MHQRPLAETAKPSAKLGITAGHQHEAHFDFWPVYAGLKFYLHKHTTKKNSIPQVVAKDFGDANIHSRTLRALELAQIMRLVSTAAKRPTLLDMVSEGLLDMFNENAIPMWLTYGVQLHFDSQDILGEAISRPQAELDIYANCIMGANEDITDNWKDPLLPKCFQDTCYIPFREAYNEMSLWAFNGDGFGEQWKQLTRDPKPGGHPTLKLLKSEEYYFYKRNPLLSGMMKYHFLLHWHAAGLSHEATTCSMLFMAQVYMGIQLRNPADPVWPDMEFVLFNQDPRYVLLKRPPETPEEARTLFDLATGQPTAKQVRLYDLNRLNLNRGDLGKPGYDPNIKSRFFRDASVFGETVYLPKGASAYWIDKVPGGSFNGRIDTIATALLAATSPEATRGRLARAIKESQEKQGGLSLEPINGRDGLTSVAIPQHFAFWLQADMPDLCFDWTLMQRQCSDTWKAIYKALEKDPYWDRSYSKWGQPPQHATNAIINTSSFTPEGKVIPPEAMYPRFMNIARQAMRNHLQQQDEEFACPRSEVCLTNMIRYHKRTAGLFTDDGPLSVDHLYECWTVAEKQARRATLAEAAEDAEFTEGNADLQDMMQDQRRRAHTMRDPDNASS